MLNDLKNLPPFSSFLSEFEKQPSLLYEKLWNLPKALFCMLLLKETNRSVLIITGGEREHQLMNDFGFFDPEIVLEFPSWETLPGEEIAPSPDIVGKRLNILKLLKTPKIVLAPLQAILQKLPSPKTLFPLYLTWNQGQNLSFSSLIEKLTQLGYRRAKIVSDKGEFALRGGILDLYPLQSFDPYRIEFVGDTIEQIRTFDPITQKSIEKRTSIEITPASEEKFLKEEKNLSLITDYFESPPHIVFDDLLAIEDKYVSIKNLPGTKSSLFLPFEDFLMNVQNSKTLYFTKQNIEELSPSLKKLDSTITFEIFGKKIQTKRMQQGLETINGFFPPPLFESLHSLSPKATVIFITASEAEEKKLKEDLNTYPFTPTFQRGYLSSGFVYPPKEFVLLPYAEISGRSKILRPKWRNSYHTPASEFHQLEVGDLVVHFHSGIGRFLGIEKQKNHLGEETEFFIIEYANKSKLYVPLSQSHLVSRYIGAGEEAPSLHALGTKNWQRIKAKTEASIIGYAKDLLNLQAQRIAQGGTEYPPDGEDVQLFELEFPFEATKDQIQAITSIKEDMCSKKAMDRLICGDVGYGKTEVAMRAAFKAIIDGGKQVAVLVPTTVLAMQHFETFAERMANFPIKIALLSRFRKQKEIQHSLYEIEKGSVDVVIGTHRIIGKDVKFKNLGLIIIDEEQRFGVRAKEHLKKLKVGVDCLTLSATPIPRTLYLSLVGARDLTVINTPPQDRLPIKTILAVRDSQMIKNALLRELSRDGQAYFIHNRVETIYKVAEEIKTLLPDTKIAVVHGQMDADQIDDAFHAFKKGETKILIATTIVENGIDIPNANTILIDRADAFGLADLYQLRGRVGRWNRPAYAYFLIPKQRELPEISKKRLHALVETSGHGGGMKLAMKDLEIRGAGDILGVQQSGQVSAVGFHLYCKLLKRAVDALSKNKPLSFLETKLEFPFKAYLPETYINETSLRLEIYHRLGEATSNETIDEILGELKDRFGAPPQEVLWLYHLSRIRLFANLHGFILLKLQNQMLSLEKQTGNKTLKETFTLNLTQNPLEFENALMQLLKMCL